VEGYVIRDGVVRVGGFGTGGLEAEAGGELIKLIFRVRESGAAVELLRAQDDLREYVILK
jgi:hypothetical protein